jgi:hypothetical protein
MHLYILKKSDRILINALIITILFLSGILLIASSRLINTKLITSPLIVPLPSSIKTSAANDPQHDFKNSTDGSDILLSEEPHPMYDLKSCIYYSNDIIELSVYGIIDKSEGNMTNGHAVYNIQLEDPVGNYSYLIQIRIASDNEIRASDLLRTNDGLMTGVKWNGTNWIDMADPVNDVEADLCVDNPHSSSSIIMDLSGVPDFNWINMNRSSANVSSSVSTAPDFIMDYGSISFSIDPNYIFLILMTIRAPGEAIPSYPLIHIILVAIITILLIITAFIRKGWISFLNPINLI